MTPVSTLAAGVGINLASTVMVEAVKALYGIADSLNDFINDHIDSMKNHDNPTISRTGRVMEMAKYGFGLGYIAPVVVIAVGQVILGNPLAAGIVILKAATLTNPIAMTCAALGAIYYGWAALSDQERNELLEKLSNGLQIGVELIKSIVRFVVETSKELLSSKNFEELKKHIGSVAAIFGKTLGEITHKLTDIIVDTLHTVQGSAGRAIDKTAELTSSGYKSIKEAAEKTVDTTGEVFRKRKAKCATKQLAGRLKTPRQNRVDPFGELISTEARGTFMGNRGGALHNDDGELTDRRWTNNRWIICRLEFKGRKRPIMAPGSYTELFFLDEAAALAAGHRPCAECRREDFNRFKAAWVAGNPHCNFTEKTSIGHFDSILQKERVTINRQKVTYQDQLGNLPEGTFFASPDQPETSFIVWQGSVWQWSPQGYVKTASISTETKVDVLTPVSTVNALRAGYTPQVFL